MNKQLNITAAALLILSASAVAAAQGLAANDSLINKGRVAVFIGTICDQYVQKHFPNAKIAYVNSEAELFLSVRAGKTDYAILGAEFAGQIAKENPDFEAVHITGNPDDMIRLGFAFSKERAKLLAQFNEFLTELKSGGELDRLIDGWRHNFDNMPAPKITNNGSGGVIRFGTTGSEVPNTAIRNGELVGFDIDIAYRFANRYNYHIDVSKYNFAGLVPAIASGKAEMAAAGMAITEERAKSVNFSDPYAHMAFYILGLRGGGPQAAEPAETKTRRPFITIALICLLAAGALLFNYLNQKKLTAARNKTSPAARAGSENNNN